MGMIPSSKEAPMHARPRICIVTAALATLAAGLLAGCSASFVPKPVSEDHVPIGNIQGIVHGGQAPITGASIYLYQASTSGYNSPATSLICNSALMSGTCPSNAYEDSNSNYYVQTDSKGNFALSGDYVCTSGSQVYMVAVGGNPGLSGNVNNTAIVQMAALGQCPAAGSMAAQVPYVVINEVTTVAFAYSVAGFATTAYYVSTDAGGTTALANAFANANNIVNIRYGQAPSSTIANSSAVNPQAKLYALANILATCVNTSSSTSTSCLNLFKYATDSSGTQPTDEAGAIFNIAHNQAQNVTNIWNLTPTTGVFAPTLTAQPTDWTMPIVYNNAISKYATNGTTITAGAFDMAADTSGNMWIGDEVNGVVEVSPLGNFSLHTKDANGTTFGEVKGVEVDASGNIWVSDAVNNKINILNSSGTATFTSSAGSGGMNGPAGIAFDSTGNAYVANDTGGTMSVFKASTGAQMYSNARAFGGLLSSPAWIAVDSLGDAFLPSQNSTYLGGDAPGKATGNTFSFSNAYALTIDASDNLWMLNNTGTGPWYIYEISCPQKISKSTGLVTGVSCTQQSSVTNLGGMNIPDRIALDGDGTLWMANQGATSVSAYNITGKKYSTGNGWLATRGFQTAASDSCLSATPDISGNIWTGNKDGSVTELLGLAAPTKAPYVPGNYQTKP